MCIHPVNLIFKHIVPNKHLNNSTVDKRIWLAVYFIYLFIYLFIYIYVINKSFNKMTELVLHVAYCELGGGGGGEGSIYLKHQMY